MNIEIQNLCFSYGDQKVLRFINFSFDETRPVVLLGPSGMGKTTLLRAIAGLITPQSGKILGLTDKTRLSVMFQEDRLFPQMNVYKNLKIVRPELSRQEAARLLAELNLTDPQILDQLPRALSGGMRRRVALARTLVFKADAVLMDEPFQGLDGKTHAMALAAVKKHTRGRPLLLISHDPEDGRALEARIVTMEEITHDETRN